MQDIHIWTGPPGAGKTHSMLKKMAAEPGRYVLACPRIDLIQERVVDLRRHAADAGTRPTLIEIHGENDSPASVTRQLANGRIQCEADTHVVLAVTHQALIQSDLSLFSGWHARLDEAPSSVKSGCMGVPVTSLFLPTLFDLDPVACGWSKLAVRPGVTKLSMLMQDHLFRDMADLYGLAEHQGVYVDITGWQQLQGSTRGLRWASVWTPHLLSAFDSCEIAAASYEHSMGNLVMQSLYPGQVNLTTTVIAPQLRSSLPAVEINCFTRAHQGSTEFWKTDDGVACIKAVAAHLEKQKIGYWSCNSSFGPHFSRINGQHVAPKVEGTNSLSQHTSCAFIYSSKARPADTVFNELFDITADQVTRAREAEDIYQFIYRGALRDPLFNGVYQVWLYESQQAEVLKSMLETDGFSVILNEVDDAGIMGRLRPKKVGRPPSRISDEERRIERREKDKVNKQQRRAKAAITKKKTGTHRGPGRPRKDPAKGTGNSCPNIPADPGPVRP